MDMKLKKRKKVQKMQKVVADLQFCIQNAH